MTIPLTQEAKHKETAEKKEDEAETDVDQDLSSFEGIRQLARCGAAAFLDAKALVAFYRRQTGIEAGGIRRSRSSVESEGNFPRQSVDGLSRPQGARRSLNLREEIWRRGGSFGISQGEGGKRVLSQITGGEGMGSGVLIEDNSKFSSVPDLPRRQDLPSDLFLAPELLEGQDSLGWEREDENAGDCALDVVRRGRVMLFALSFAWLRRSHPDTETGYHLSRVCAFFEKLMEDPQYSDKTLGLFWDFASMYQKPRTPEEERLFRKALRNMNIIYSHRFVCVLRSCGIPSSAENRTPYRQRGWPYFEVCVSAMKSTEILLNLPEETEEGDPSWVDLIPAFSDTDTGTVAVAVGTEEFEEQVRLDGVSIGNAGVVRLCQAASKFYSVQSLRKPAESDNEASLFQSRAAFRLFFSRCPHVGGGAWDSVQFSLQGHMSGALQWEPDPEDAHTAQEGFLPSSLFIPVGPGAFALHAFDIRAALKPLAGSEPAAEARLREEADPLPSGKEKEDPPQERTKGKRLMSSAFLARLRPFCRRIKREEGSEAFREEEQEALTRFFPVAALPVSVTLSLPPASPHTLLASEGFSTLSTSGEDGTLFKLKSSAAVCAQSNPGCWRELKRVCVQSTSITDSGLAAFCQALSEGDGAVNLETFHLLNCTQLTSEATSILKSFLQTLFQQKAKLSQGEQLGEEEGANGKAQEEQVPLRLDLAIQGCDSISEKVEREIREELKRLMGQDGSSENPEGHNSTVAHDGRDAKGDGDGSMDPSVMAEKVAMEIKGIQEVFEGVQREGRGVQLSGDVGARVERLGILVVNLRKLGDEVEFFKTKNESLEKQFKEERHLRKKYFNEIEDMKGKIRVYCRLRPMAKYEVEKGSEDVVELIDEFSLKAHSQRGVQDFTFDKVFGPQSTQEEVFEDVRRLVSSAVDGFNVGVFTFGQTGTGKTYTIFGGGPGREGIAQRSIWELFKVLEASRISTVSWDVKVSVCEIYLDNLRDLLVSSKRHEKPPPLAVHKNASGAVYLEGAEIKVNR
uniref:Kinesin motor domain-containing protein n=1 Tax=Chromera velia CCMP2878 TaxID=1169474 RepID=A0A0G4FCF8_9ALVE|eukprot:Cvel_16360.t1-p1 / transcript=Cvel_16360.t1 / gene=Cvel_16360 / organism=Chromera_velia_CCMP2878 / gene_product=Kinesin-like calmodulin-binding protein homolog, putative / transcript_product=Kinesin-like calmodulin-binding protein homolog, putative / location=Cvel_scaffold1256:43989-51072(+) / protein_length=1024 / sequence_SO=supercontig / SO=protein_coding / is_pseudo=false